MEYSSIRRSKRTSSDSSTNTRHNKTFSTSNLSSISTNSNNSTTSIGRKTFCLNLPEDFGAQVSIDGRIRGLVRNGPAHASGLIQIGDYVRILDVETTEESEKNEKNEEGFITLHVTYGILQVQQRPSCPFVIEIGNRSYTALGLALTDNSEKFGDYRDKDILSGTLQRKRKKREIRISSIQNGSLADRCGFLRPGDLVTSIHICGQTETIPCSPFYTSYQVAQILRKLTSTEPSITLTVVPGSTDVTTSFDNEENYTSSSSGCVSTTSTAGTTGEPLGRDVEDETNQCVLSLCLWKDSSFDDWGFSIVDEDDITESNTNTTDEYDEHESQIQLLTSNSRRKPISAVVHKIRPGGPAFLAGLRSGDKILLINDRDVSTFESTILVPILASLDDALNLFVLRNQ